MKRTQRILAYVSFAGLAILFALTLLISIQFQSAGYYLDQPEHSRSILIAVQNLNRGLVKAENAFIAQSRERRERGYRLWLRFGPKLNLRLRTR